MGVNADRRAAIGEFERGHLQRSYKRSLVALSVALAVSLLGFSGLWIVGAYGVAFWLGWRIGIRARSGEAWRAEMGLARLVAWDDVRPGTTVFVALLPVLFLLSWITAFGSSVEGMDPESLSADEALRLMAEAYGWASAWDHPWFAGMAAGAVFLAAVSGLNDGLWVGTVQSRTGVRFRQAVPFGRDWAEWRRERRERRREYLGGGS